MQLERRHTQTPSPALQVSLRLKNNMIAVRVGEPQVLATSESHSDRTALTHVLNVYMMCICVYDWASRYSAGYSTWGNPENLEPLRQLATTDMQRELLRPPGAGMLLLFLAFAC